MVTEKVQKKRINAKFRSYKIINIDDLRNFEHNSRTHSEEQIQQVIDSIHNFGFTNPLLVDNNNVLIAGHCRLEAAKRIGFDTIPCIVVDDLNEVQKAALVIADNKLALNAGWDYDKLWHQISYLKETGFNTDLTGFKADEIATFKPEVVPSFEGDEDAIPDLPIEPITKLGDVWVLGNHRLMCGDATFSDQVSKLLNGTNPVLMVTDPPYGVNYDPEWRDGYDLGVGDRSKGKVKNDDKADWTDAYSLFPGDVAYVWHAGVYSPDIAYHLKDCGFNIVSQVIWVKQHFALSRGDYHWQHEPCWYAVKKGKKHNWQGARDQSTTWEIKNNNSFGNANKEKTWGHGTQKPLACMEKPILNNSKENDFIYDPFGGSGTTLIACEKNNRNCLMMELDPIYCDVIVRRWEDFTGKKAYLETDNVKKTA